MKFLKLNDTDAVNLEHVELFKAIPNGPVHTVFFQMTSGTVLQLDVSFETLQVIDQALWEGRIHHGKDKRAQHRPH